MHLSKMSLSVRLTLQQLSHSLPSYIRRISRLLSAVVDGTSQARVCATYIQVTQKASDSIIFQQEALQFRRSQPRMHHPIPTHESGERLLAEATSRKKHSKQYVIACPTTTLIVLFIVVTASTYVLGYFTGQHVQDSNSLCALRTSKYCMSINPPTADPTNNPG